MEEIAQQFKEEYTKLLSRYKDKLTNPQIMSVLQSVTRKQIGIRNKPERFERIFNNAVHNLAEDHLKQITTSGSSFLEHHALKVPADLIKEPDPEFKKMMQGEFRCID